MSIGPDEDRVVNALEHLEADCTVALHWAIDEKRWDDAYALVHFGPPLALFCPRHHLVDLLAKAARKAEPAPAYLPYLELWLDELDIPTVECNRRAWDLWDSGWQPPTDRVSGTPLESIGGDVSTGLRPEQLLAALDRIDTAPFPTRVMAHYMVLADLAGTVPTIGQQGLDNFATMVATSGSTTARGLNHGLLGQYASIRGDWNAAFHHFTEAVRDGENAQGYLLGVRTNWFRIAAATMAGEHVGNPELAHAWRLAQAIRTPPLWGACVTALVLQRQERHELARDFRQWLANNDPGGITDVFIGRLPGAAFVAEPPNTELIDLPELVDELLYATDRSGDPART